MQLHRSELRLSVATMAALIAAGHVFASDQMPRSQSPLGELAMKRIKGKGRNDLCDCGCGRKRKACPQRAVASRALRVADKNH